MNLIWNKSVVNVEVNRHYENIIKEEYSLYSKTRKKDFFKFKDFYNYLKKKFAKEDFEKMEFKLMSIK